MGYAWKTCPSEIKDFIFNINKSIKEIINDSYVGFYIHGSLAMGGFNPKSSDIDVLVITYKSMEIEYKRNLARLLLDYSNSPYPIEISFLNTKQLRHWQHPCPYDFHYSEFWRERFEKDLLNGTYQFLNGDIHTDADLAAHLTITYQRGICVEGKPIKEVFPLVPRSDYISSILGDYQDCLENIEEDPILLFIKFSESILVSKRKSNFIQARSR
ncbi:nucleotidyltransferase domain-containing protein [Fredinandcohnia onubensis]|uniref:nucleotidyltransferase domain-containing protein n=1 Tax=Fredinandcohnia onubensis TaxID=1571209 RepID=UPI00211F3B8D|nr:nucleotidyltransferase domain-containing protein [Fredinandcohnia onubensis]